MGQTTAVQSPCASDHQVPHSARDHITMASARLVSFSGDLPADFGYGKVAVDAAVTTGRPPAIPIMARGVPNSGDRFLGAGRVADPKGDTRPAIRARRAPPRKQ